ncbi:MAG: lysine--tRNA ligase [Thermoplasmata archaeon]
MHWFDVLFPQIEVFLRGKAVVHCSAGLSVSGLQHVGRLRGEVVLTNSISEELRAKGKDVTQYLVLYTQDPWKGTEGQISQFPRDEGRDYINWRLKDVPDPFECHSSWVDHYWEDFGGYMERFAPEVKLQRTGDVYSDGDMRRIVLEFVGKSERVRPIINKYRGTRKYPEGWIPFDAFCTECNTIGTAETRKITDDGEVHYLCRGGHEGVSRMEDGKLNWRLEWPALWKLLQVDVEAFGKDHATPGGSRDSCKEIARELIDMLPPFGIPYEWVGIQSRGKDMGDMSSSGFLGFTPKDWLEIAEPEVLRYVYLFNSTSKRIVLDLSKVDSYYDRYDEAERLFFEDKDDDRARAYELSRLEEPPSSVPFQIPYRHASLLAQAAPPEDLVDWAIERLRDTGVLTTELSQKEREQVARRLALSRNWTQKYAPEDLRIDVLRDIRSVEDKLEYVDREALRKFRDSVSSIPWTEEELKNVMVRLTKSGELPVKTNRFFRSLYLVFLGKEKGPRAAPFLSVLDRDFVLGRLEEVSSQ